MNKALLIVDHGSKQVAANIMLSAIAQLLREKRPDLIVEMAHMELADPTIREGIEACIKAGATDIVVHPYMLSPGRHATRDIPRMVSDVAADFPDIKIITCEPLGVHELIIDVILERAGV